MLILQPGSDTGTAACLHNIFSLHPLFNSTLYLRMMKILQSFLLGSLLAQFTAAVNDNLPQCNGQDKDEYAFYTANIVLASVDPAYHCSELQLTTLGFLIQDIVDEVEGIMPEYKNEYIRTILCPLPKAEDDKGRQKLLLDSKVQNENIFDSSQCDLAVQRKRYCWAIYVITNFITNKNHYHNYRSEKILIISDIMTKRPKTVTRTIITTHER
jgi:hypothetical protein